MTDISEIWEAYSDNLFRFIKSRVNETDAEDILQEVFMKMHMRINDLMETSKIESWMYQITRNTIIDYYRTHKVGAELNENFDWEEEETDNQASIELAACLQPMINHLPSKYKTAVMLSEIDGKTQKEVAELENISLSGAKSRVQRGRLLMKQMLEDCCKISTDKFNTPIEYHPKNCDCKDC